MTPENYCNEQVAQRGTDLYYSLLYAPSERRQAIINLHAFYNALNDILNECSDPQVARTKLNWWQEELGKIFIGQATHPIGKALTDTFARYQLPHKLLQGLVSGFEYNLENMHYPTFGDVVGLCHQTMSLLSILIAHVLGEVNQQILLFARDLGASLRMIQMIQNIRNDAAHSYVYLPEQELNNAGVQLQDIFQFKMSMPLKKVIQAQADKARTLHQQALSYLPVAERHRYINQIIEAELALRLLDELEKDEFQIFQHRIALTPLRKFWIACKVMRREKKLKG